MKKILTLFFVAAAALSVTAQEAADCNVTGQFRDTDGNPIKDVVVTDGYTVMATDAEGRYAFNRHDEAAYVYFTLPANYKVPMRQGHPCFYKKLTDAKVYDFVLREQKVEHKFNLFMMADPQCQNIRHVHRFKSESVPDICKSAKRYGKSNYAITLGDIVYSEGPRNATYLMPIMREEMREEKMGMPVFQTIGNHDEEYELTATNKRSSTPSKRMQRMFEAVFGPIDYSWERGDAHIVSMSNIVYKSVESNKYYGDFTDEQVAWLRKDLSYVPKNKLVIFCVHIPLEHLRKRDNVKEVIELLGEYDNCHIMSGHTHYTRNYIHKNGIYEHILAAVSGCWWWSQNNGDGAPNGYGIFRVDGNEITDWIYKSVGYPESHQLRLYRGDAEFGGSYERLKLPFGGNVLLANVWNADRNWKIEVYENNKLVGKMKKMKPSPFRGDEYPSLTSSKDWWAIGYNVGVVGRGNLPGSTRKNYCTPCHHMYTWTLKDPDAKIKVVATDPWGRKYTATHVIAGAEYATAEPPKYEVSEVW